VSAHRATVVDQFTRQAPGFAAAAPIRDAQLLSMLTAASGVRAGDRVLDVACGPGIVTCAFAPLCGQAVGIDLVSAMLGRARGHAAQLGLANAEFIEGDVEALPWEDGVFDLVVTRFLLHHLEEPGHALGEMARVCRSGGAVLVCDLAPAERSAAAFNALERLRDPSHVRALTERELRELFEREPLLDEPAVTRGSLGLELEAHLARSFPARVEDAGEVRSRVQAAVRDDAPGIAARPVGDRIEYAYPLVVLVAGRR
jgi:SAM-dependent methyltransferase